MSQRLLSTAAVHSQWSFLSFFDKGCSYAADTLLSAGAGPVSRLAEAAVTGFLRNMRHGCLRIVTPSTVHTFPAASYSSAKNSRPDLFVELVVVNPNFWTRMLCMGDLGFAEAYMVCARRMAGHEALTKFVLAAVRRRESAVLAVLLTLTVVRFSVTT